MDKVTKKFTLDFMNDWVNTILDVVDQCYSKERDDELRDIVNSVYYKSDLAGFKYIFNDVSEMAYSMHQNNIDYLNRMLKEKFGISLEDKNKIEYFEIKAIIKRGFIRNDEEFYMMKEWIDRIMDEEGQEKEAEIMDKLLFDYEMSKGRS